MSTKLRSACDKCHEAKVRCSGDVPCQGCLASRSLCFYSPSNPLGRPRGTKKQPREGSRGNNTWDREDAANGDINTTMAGVTGDRTPRQKRIRSNNGGSVPRNVDVSNGQRDDTSDLLGAGCPAPGGNSSFVPDSGQDNNGGMPEDFNPLSCSDARASTSVTWDDLIAGVDSDASSDLLRTGGGDFTYSSKGFSTTQNSVGDDALPNLNPQPPFRSGFESRLPVSVPTGPQEMATANRSASMNPMGGVSPRISTPNTCTCLQKHAEVLSNPILAETRSSDGLDDGFWSMDKALSLAKHAMKAWQSLLACPYCPYDDDQEVVLLTFMSIRGVTRYLQRLYPRYTHPSPQSSGTSSPQSIKDDDRLQIGSFELEGYERVLVLRVLFQLTLQKVKSILHSLQMIQNTKKRRLLEKTQNKPAGFDDYQASSNLFHIQQISHGLVTTLQALESSLNSLKDPGAPDPLGTLQASKDV